MSSSSSQSADRPVRLAQSADRDQLAPMLNALWPDSSAEEHGRELVPILAGKSPGTLSGTLPLVILVAEASDGALVGFIEVGLRSHANGCDPAHPVGYVEGERVPSSVEG